MLAGQAIGSRTDIPSSSDGYHLLSAREVVNSKTPQRTCIAAVGGRRRSHGVVDGQLWRSISGPHSDDGDDAMDRIVTCIQAHLLVKAKNNSSVISVQFEAGAPDTASVVVNAIMATYLSTVNAARDAQIAKTDQWISQQMAINRQGVKSVMTLKDPLAHYRVHCNSMSSWTKPTIALLQKEIRIFKKTWDEVVAAFNFDKPPFTNRPLYTSSSGR